MVPDLQRNEMLDRAVRLATYQHFVSTGQAPSTESIAAKMGRPVGDVSEALRRLADAHILVLSPGSEEIWMAMPFSAVPTSFRVRNDTQAWWANCAWDALGITAATESDVDIDSTCANDGQPLPLTVHAGEVRGAGFVHFAVPAAHWWDDIGFT